MARALPPRPAATAEPLVGSSAGAPQPHDPQSVRSVVRWGTRSGKYSQQTEGDDSLVYTYVYPQSARASGCRRGGAGRGAQRGLGRARRQRQLPPTSRSRSRVARAPTLSLPVVRNTPCRWRARSV